MDSQSSPSFFCTSILLANKKSAFSRTCSDARTWRVLRTSSVFSAPVVDVGLSQGAPPLIVAMSLVSGVACRGMRTDSGCHLEHFAVFEFALLRSLAFHVPHDQAFPLTGCIPENSTYQRADNHAQSLCLMCCMSHSLAVDIWPSLRPSCNVMTAGIAGQGLTQATYNAQQRRMGTAASASLVGQSL